MLLFEEGKYLSMLMKEKAIVVEGEVEMSWLQSENLDSGFCYLQ